MKKKLSVISIIAGSLSLLSVVVPMIIGTILKIQTSSASISLIGGADGPTSIVLVGTIGMGSVMFEVVIGIILIIVGIWGLKKCKKK